MKLLAIINLISFFCGNVYHTPTEIQDNHALYPMTMMVYATEIDDKGTETVEDDDGIITLIDGANLLWTLEQYPEDYYVGDYVALIMDDNGTPETIYDDIIVNMRATGFWKGKEINE